MAYAAFICFIFHGICNDPLSDPLPPSLHLLECRALDPSDSAAVMTSRLVNALSTEMSLILSTHPINAERASAGKPLANAVLLRGCGAALDVPSFKDLHGLRGFMIAPTCIIAGLGTTIGLDVLKVDGATGDYATNLSAKADRAIREITSGQYDFGFVHIKAVDDAAHDRAVERRVEWISRIDSQVVAPIVEALAHDEERPESGGQRYAVVVTGDHSSPVIYGDHSCEPVPFVLCPVANMSIKGATENRVLCDSVVQFNEVAAARGALGRFCGAEVMPLLKHVAAAL